MTSGNSQTLTLSGFNGYKITNITLSMKSNKSAGAGGLTYSTDGGTTTKDIVGAKTNFSNTAWNGSYTQDYTNISKDVNIECGTSNIVFVLSCSTNSLYCQSYTITYTSSAPAEPIYNYWYVNGEEHDITETITGNPVLPAAPEVDCDGRVFVGWTTEAYKNYEHDTDKPAVLFKTAAEANTYTTTDGETFYAVFAREIGGGEVSSINVTLANGKSSGTDTSTTITWEKDGVVSILQEKGKSSNNVSSSYVSAPRWYQNHIITFTPQTTITKVEITATEAYATVLGNSTYTNATASASGTTATITPTDGSQVFTVKLSAQSRPTAIKVYYGGRASYSDYVTDCNTCTTLAAPTITALTSTHNSITVEWESVTGATGYTIAYKQGENEPVGENVGSNVFTKTFEGLTPNTTYTIGLRANGDGTTYCDKGEVVNQTISTKQVPTYTLQTAVSPVGAGTISLTKGGANGPESAEGAQPLDEIITATADAEAGYSFVRWEYSGNEDNFTAEGTTAYILLEASNEITLTAVFEKSATYELKTAVSPAGSGSITLDPSGAQAAGTSITATAEPANGYRFTGWTYSGDNENNFAAEGASAIIELEASSDITLTANFELIPTYIITWMYNGAKYIVGEPTPSVFEGGSIEKLPTQPSTPNACSDKDFVGWTDDPTTLGTEQQRLYNNANEISPITSTSPTTFYAVFATANRGTATLVTDASSLEVGQKVIIAAASSNYAISTTQNENNRVQTEITKSGNTLTPNTDTQIFTLEAGTKDDTWAFYAPNTDENTTGYIYAASSSSNHLKTHDTKDNNSSWEITVTAEGIATVQAQGTYTRNWLRYNSTSKIFSCYSSGQSDIALYTLTTTYSDYAIECCNSLGTFTASTTSITSTTFNAEWTALENAASYTFTLQKDGVDVEGYPITLNKNKLEVTGLAKSTTYTWSVTAIGKTDYCDAVSEKQTVETFAYDCTGRTASFAQDEVTKQIGEVPFTNPLTITENEDETVQDGGTRKFTSSNTNAATVNETTGEVTIVGEGTTTISVTVSQTGTTPIYCEVEASYTLTVTKQKFTVTWKYNHTGDYATTEVFNGEKVVDLPTPPSTPAGWVAEKNFVGWTATAIMNGDEPTSTDTKPSDLFTDVDGSPYIKGNTTFYAVFARPAYKKITAAGELTVGDIYVLVCDEKQMELNGISATNTPYGIGTTYENIGIQGLMPLEAVSGSTEGSIAFKNGTSYLCWASGNSLNTTDVINNSSSWTVTVTDGNATIANIETSERTIRWNASSPRFACYTSDQQAVQLYKKLTSPGYTTSCATSDAEIMEGTVTVATNDAAQHLTVHAGAKLALTDGAALNVASITLRSEGDKVAQLIIPSGSELVSNTTTLRFVKRIHNDRYYFFSLPFDCKISDITVNGEAAVMNSNILIKYYDGAGRANNGGTESNWKTLTGSTLQAGVGYEVAVASDTEVDIVFSMAMSHGNIHTHENTTKEFSYAANNTGKFASDSRQCGWNLMGTAHFSNHDASSWGEMYISTYNEDGYDQKPANAMQQPLSPFSSFFIQVNGDGSLAFNKTLPAGIAARHAQAQDTKRTYVGVSLSNGERADETTLVIGNQFTQAYEIGADLEKMLTLGTKPQLYTVEDKAQYAFKAINETDASKTNMLGVYLPTEEETEYTFSLMEHYDLSEVQTVYLTDYVANVTVNLMQSDYTFTSSKEHTDKRFAISAILSSHVTTDLSHVPTTWSVYQDGPLHIRLVGITDGDRVRVIDTTGKVVYTTTANSFYSEINLPQAGVYCIETVGAEGLQVKKVMVK